MNLPIEIVLLSSGVGVVQSAFLGIYLFTLKSGRRLANVLLALLLLSLSVRIFKSLVYYFSDLHHVPVFIQNIGYAANLAILPLLWLYLNAYLRADFTFSWRRDLIHLVPCALALLFTPVLTPHFWMNLHGYSLSLFAMGPYVPFCFHLIYKNLKFISPERRIWLGCIVVGVAAVWVLYFANFVLRAVSYISAPMTFSLVVYGLTFFGLRSKIFDEKEKYVKSSFSPADVDRCYEHVRGAMAGSRLYKDPDLTIAKVARELSVSIHLLSEAINRMTGQNFNDFVNGYRVNDAAAMLADPAHSHRKISAIAFETGFNSLSSFNASFKKIKGITPSQYRRLKVQSDQ